jgi:hypothetical protein
MVYTKTARGLYGGGFNPAPRPLRAALILPYHHLALYRWVRPKAGNPKSRIHQSHTVITQFKIKAQEEIAMPLVCFPQ